MGAGQSADMNTLGPEGYAARRAFFREHGRDPTEEEAHKFKIAFAREDPTDAHLGTVTAEEADVCREIVRQKLAKGSEPTEMLSTFTEKLARCMRRAALEAVEPDVEAVRRELVRRAVEAEKASGGGEVVPFGPPPRPADESAAESPCERAARLEHEKVRVVAAAAHAVWSSTDCDSKTVKGGLDNLISVANSDDAWDDKVRFQGAIIAKLRTATRELHMAAADHTIAEATTARDRTYATTLQDIARGVYELENCSVDCGVDAADARRICERVELAKAGAAPVRAASDPERECPICLAGAVDGARAVRPHPVPGVRGGARVLPRLPRGGHEPPAAVSLAIDWGCVYVGLSRFIEEF